MSGGQQTTNNEHRCPRVQPHVSKVGGTAPHGRCPAHIHVRDPIRTMPRKVWASGACTQCHVSTLLHLSTLSLKINGQRSVDENQWSVDENQWSVDENQWSMVKLEWSVAELNGQNAIFSGQPSMPRSRTSMVKSKSVVNSPKRNAVVNDEW